MKTLVIRRAAALALTLTSLACAGEPPADSEPAAAPAAAESATPTEAGAVTYEPAYPEEVSGEELAESDVAQQEAEHAHADGAEHSHGPDSDHDHDHGDDHDH